MKASLTVIGLGIKFLSHLTVEARAYIEKADKVLYLTNDPASEQWILKRNQNCESLDKLYFAHEKRIDAYSAISSHIIDSIKEPKNVCVVLYGHPTFFAKPALDAVVRAKKLSLNAKVLPAVSTVDCLLADLCIDPSNGGCQIFECTDFLIYKRRFDTGSHLILMQPDVIGHTGHRESNDELGIQLLKNHLKKFYPLEHKMSIYEAAQYPGLKAKIIHCHLESLSQHLLSSISTLYIQPLGQATIDRSYAKYLGLPQK